MDEVVTRVRALLGSGGRGTPATRNAEVGFLINAILPSHPAARQTLMPPDLPAARALRARLDRLADAGLITPDEQTAERHALDDLIASGRLPTSPAARAAAQAHPGRPRPPPKAASRLPTGDSAQSAGRRGAGAGRRGHRAGRSPSAVDGLGDLWRKGMDDTVRPSIRNWRR